MSAANPLDAVGPPPPTDDPHAQAEYLTQVLDAFAAIQEPRIKPLRARLLSALAELHDNEDGKGRERHVAAMKAVQIDVYELVITIINQIRTTLKVQLGRGMATPARLGMEKLQKQLGDQVRAMLKTVSALKSTDSAKFAEAARLLEEAQRGMQELQEQID
ncbi:MAG: hypothetical protein H7Z43_03000 [Clostridia bacterium]|nr:hypothetical protein [Deltaproteobacteria bacterium]